MGPETSEARAGKPPRIRVEAGGTLSQLGRLRHRTHFWEAAGHRVELQTQEASLSRVKAAAGGAVSAASPPARNHGGTPGTRDRDTAEPRPRAQPLLGWSLPDAVPRSSPVPLRVRLPVEVCCPTLAWWARRPEKPRVARRVAHPGFERVAQPPVPQRPEFVWARAAAGRTLPSPGSHTAQDPDRLAPPQIQVRTYLHATPEARPTPATRAR